MRPEPPVIVPEIGRVKRLIALRTFPGWTDITPREMAVVAEHAQPRFFPKGSHLIHEGRPVTSMHMVVTGAVELRRHGHVLRQIGERGTAGALAMMARDPEGYDCVALVDTTTLMLTLEDLEDIFEENFDILRAALKAISEDVTKIRRGMGATAGFRENFEEGLPCPVREMDLVERMFFLRKSVVTASGRLDAIAEMARMARELRLEAGDVLWRAGDIPRELIVLACGTLACTSADGTQRFRFGPGDVVGGLDALAGTLRWYDAVAQRPTVLLAMDVDAVVDGWEDHIEIPMGLVRLLSKGLLEMLERTARPGDAEGRATARLDHQGARGGDQEQ